MLQEKLKLPPLSQNSVKTRKIGEKSIKVFDKMMGRRYNTAYLYALAYAGALGGVKT